MLKRIEADQLRVVSALAQNGKQVRVIDRGLHAIESGRGVVFEVIPMKEVSDDHPRRRSRRVEIIESDRLAKQARRVRHDACERGKALPGNAFQVNDDEVFHRRHPLFQSGNSTPIFIDDLAHGHAANA